MLGPILLLEPDLRSRRQTVSYSTRIGPESEYGTRSGTNMAQVINKGTRGLAAAMGMQDK